MRTLITFTILLFCLQLWAQIPDTTSVAPGRLIIKVSQAFQTIGTRSDGIIETDQTWFNNLAVQYQIDVLQQMYVGNTRAYQHNKYLICFPDSLDLETIVSSFEMQSAVQDVRYDFYVHLCTDDPFNSYQWSLQRINANTSYYTLASSIQAPQAVRIAVVDTGIDFNHPDLSTNILRDQNNNVIGYNVLSPINDTMDDNGHGTLMAGIIAAQTNNNAGISSLVTGNNVKLMPIKAFNYQQRGWISDVCNGIDWAIDHGAQIINCSWVTYQDTVWPEELLTLIEENPNILFITARGRYNQVTFFPGMWSLTHSNIITVSGSNYNDYMSYDGSEYVSVCAPSGTYELLPGWTPHDQYRGIVSTLPVLNPTDPYQMHYSVNDPSYYAFQMGSWQESNNYDFYTGTSISTAQVSGLVGMLWAKYYTQMSNNSMIVGDLKDIVRKSAKDFIGNTYNYIYSYHGSGIINAYEALSGPNPNLSLRSYQVGTRLFNYPLNDQDIQLLLPSMEWGSSQAIRIQIHNKWVIGNNVTIRMSTNDPNISFSYPGESDRYNIGSIAAESTIWTPDMWIRDWSNQVRTNVPITIEISATNMPVRVYTILINILPNSTSYASSVTMQANETISTDLVTKDIDGNGIDELLVGTSMGRILCFKNGNWNTVGALPASINMSPAIGDINADGLLEIVAIDFDGNIRVYSSSYVLLRSYPCFQNESTIGTVTLEDVTGDNILDIIYSTNRANGSLSNAGVRVIDYYRDTPYAYLTNNLIAAALIVGNVDDDAGYEIVVSYADRYDTQGATTVYPLNVAVLKVSNNQLIESYAHLFAHTITSLLDPHIMDVNEDGDREIVWILTDNNFSRRIVFSVAQNSELSNHPMPLTTCYNSEVGKIIENSNNLASLYSYTTTGNHYVRLANGIENGQGYYTCIIRTDQPVKGILSAALLPVQDNYSSQQVLIMTDHAIDFYRIRYNLTNPDDVPQEIWEHCIDFGLNVNLVSIAISERNLTKILSAITNDGKIYEYSYPSLTGSVATCQQHRQSSRHTGCYEQPIPKEVRGDIAIKHPFTVDKPLTTYSSIFTINEGVVGRFEAGRSLTLNRSDLNINGSEEKPVVLKGLGGGTSNEYWKGINVNNGSNLEMNWAEITGAHQALDISYTGNRLIKNSKFYNNYQNVNCYNATVNLFNNYLTDAIHAVSAYHYASPMLNNTVLLQNGLNEIAGNEYGIFSDSSTPILKDGHNNLENDRYNLFLQNLPLMSGPIPAERNWWGYTDYRDVAATINLPDRVSFVPYDMQPNQTLVREDQSSGVFEDGYAYLLNRDYRNAIDCFQSVLADSLINESDVVSLYAMLECYNQLNELTSYETQLDQFVSVDGYFQLHKPMKNVRALIYRATDRFSQAIDHYETILLNNPSFQDSCYAVIDLGDTYLESNGRSSGQLSQYIPVSYALHQQNREALLSLISSRSDTENSTDTTPPLQLMGNYPNPFNPTTTIRFQMKADSNVKLDIYNIRGQKVTTLLNENRPAGLNSVVWNGKDSKNAPVASGVYFYRIESSNSTKTAKMLLLK